MKILVAAASGIYDDAFPETRRANTGFNHMIRAYADMFCRQGDEVDILTQSVFTKGRTVGDAALLKKTWKDLFFSFKPFYFGRWLKTALRGKLGLNMTAHSAVYYMTGAFCEKLLRKNRYDVVHVNGIGVAALPFLYACARTNTPCVLTLHGLISFSDTVHADSLSKKIEKNWFLLQKADENVLSTVISTGIKKRALSFAGTDLMDNMSVILNPVIPAPVTPVEADSDKYLIVTVGNVGVRKNQKLAVDAMLCLPEDIKKNVLLYVIGGEEASLKEYAASVGADNIVFTGSVSRGVVHAYLDKASLCLLPSLDEGFGLSIVEGYAHGVPGILSDSVDAFFDLYDECAMIPFHDYTPESVADAVQKAYHREWDHDKIRKVAERFSEPNCAEQYISVFRKAADAKSALSVEEVDSLLKDSKENR